jgi:uridine kinase
VNRLSQSLKELNINCVVFHIDDFIVERKNRYNTGNEEWFEYYNLQYDNVSDNHNIKTINVPSDAVIIIEGVFLQRKEWKDFFDYTVYLKCPRNTRLHRESKETQKNMNKFRNRYWKAEEFYIKTEVPERNADLVLEG